MKKLLFIITLFSFFTASQAAESHPRDYFFTVKNVNQVGYDVEIIDLVRTEEDDEEYIVRRGFMHPDEEKNGDAKRDESGEIHIRVKDLENNRHQDFSSDEDDAEFELDFGN